MYIMRKRPEAEMRAFGEDANTVVFGTVQIRVRARDDVRYGERE